MPIVFVHGVNNRQGSAYTAGTLAKQAFLTKYLAGAVVGGSALGPSDKVWFPYWGDLAAKFAWQMASLPRGDMQSLGAATDTALEPLIGHLRDALGQLGPDPLTHLARKRLSLAVEVVTQLALDNATPGNQAEIAQFVVEASAYADANPAPAWMAGVNNDAQFLGQLAAALAPIPEVQAMGGFGQVFNAISLAAIKFHQAVSSLVGKAVDRAGDFASTKLLAWSRDSLNGVLGQFFGDVFVYLNSRGDRLNPGPIPLRILSVIDTAKAALPNEPLVIIGHSLGGVITMDLLGHFRPDLVVDAFVSVGSQVAHFEELKLYKNSDPAVARPNRAQTPANIRRWMNIYDEVDVFSYAAERVFDRVDIDARYDTETYVIKSHGAYFEQDRFYRRVRDRLQEFA